MVDLTHHSSASTSSASMASTPARSEDPAWAHSRAVPNAKNNTICLHCNKLIKGGGITRLKYHLAGIRGQVESCKAISSDIRNPYGDPFDIDEEEEEEEEVRVVEKTPTQKSPPQTLDIKNDWKVYGCSVMSNGWINQKQQPIMNFLVYCPRGAMFLKSIDTSGLTKDAETLFNTFDSVVQEIAHCIDLMLENIANPKWFPLVDEAFKKAKKITKFIYNHGVVLDFMRQDFTNGRKLYCPAITRFATNFLSLQSMLRFKKELRQMFTCDKWLSCPHAKTAVGNEVSKIVLEDYLFWSQCNNKVKVSELLVRVLRLVDRDEKPAMSAIGCERNWSTFEYVHSKKRNRLKHKRVNDLVFVHYNLRLRERNIQRNKYALDPISLDNIDLMGDRVVEELAFLNLDDIN
ncbi:uncharacterized protein LOC142632594 [Castanea sativa]|uniref:uncharacterized protein LOC142632594 n=1 Tax=Castanea sativa TaxID=21020 RepID=UPI003F653A90